jgi:hypothetical protein
MTTMFQMFITSQKLFSLRILLGDKRICNLFIQWNIIRPLKRMGRAEDAAQW